jgi:hypothetical protein
MKKLAITLALLAGLAPAVALVPPAHAVHDTKGCVTHRESRGIKLGMTPAQVKKELGGAKPFSVSVFYGYDTNRKLWGQWFSGCNGSQLVVGYNPGPSDHRVTTAADGGVGAVWQ